MSKIYFLLISELIGISYLLAGFIDTAIIIQRTILCYTLSNYGWNIGSDCWEVRVANHLSPFELFQKKVFPYFFFFFSIITVSN